MAWKRSRPGHNSLVKGTLVNSKHTAWATSLHSRSDSACHLWQNISNTNVFRWHDSLSTQFIFQLNSYLVTGSFLGRREKTAKQPARRVHMLFGYWVYNFGQISGTFTTGPVFWNVSWARTRKYVLDVFPCARPAAPPPVVSCPHSTTRPHPPSPPPPLTFDCLSTFKWCNTHLF